ncbi:MAG: NAD(P)H-hydrate dehydratase [Candidatus Omnitrophica bacterium]|nr:NAD(P)H-hydrate dehydratase [Candidatus Omnitrophota bacterium]
MPLLRNKPHRHKNDFGHVLILAGSSSMLGAAALVGLAAMRCGAGLTTIGIPKSLNPSLQQKISPVIMTLPLPETKEGTLSKTAYATIMSKLKNVQVLALGPGLSGDPTTQNLILRIIANCPLPMVIDADALTALAQDISVLQKNTSPKILTPHPGEMARLTGYKKDFIENSRKKIAGDFARNYHCTLVLKGHQSIVASVKGELSVNSTGNVGMATAGSGDVLTGMIAAFLAQGLAAYDAARLGVYLHGLAGDLAAKEKTAISLIATDIIEKIPLALKKQIQLTKK